MVQGAVESFDVVVVGGGPGGTPGALLLAGHGQRVALVEAGEGLGGTCLFEGCIPSKIFLESARRLADLSRLGEFALEGAADARIDLPRLQARKRAILQVRVDGAQVHAVGAGLTLVRGRAQLLDPHTVGVQTADGVERRLQGRVLLLAPGSETARPAVPGADDPELWTSADALRAEQVPPSMVIVGGGYIGCELASFFAAAGTRVTLIELLPHLLESEDPGAAAAVAQRLVQRGVTVDTDTRLQRIERAGSEWRVVLAPARGPESTLTVSKVLLAAGRRARTRELAWDKAGIILGSRGEVPVNRFYQTQVPHIYAPGDVNAQVMLAHAATRQSEIAAWHILGEAHPLVPLAIPHVIFTDPEVASVGEDRRALARDPSLVASRFPYAGDARAHIMGDTTGFVQLIWRPVSHELRGLQVVGLEAGELLAEATGILRRGGRIDELVETIHAHPTLGEVVAEAAAAALAEKRPV